MSGKPRFDDSAVIEAAMTVFWRKGYHAASIDELTTAMGLSRSSLYKRFRDKDGLYQEVLATYAARVLSRMENVQAENSRSQLEALLLEFVSNRGHVAKPAGCMLARACSEMAELPEGGRAVALDGLSGQRAILRKILNAAAANGELDATSDVDALTWHFMGVLQAIMNLPQAGATAADLKRMVAMAMAAWQQGSCCT